MDPFWLLLIGITVVLSCILIFRLHPFLALLLSTLIVASLTSSASLEKYARDKNFSDKETSVLLEKSIGEKVAYEFGQTFGKIGILIALASIIGKCLLESGAAERIVRSALKLFGEKRSGLSFLSSSFFLAIPVYFDTVFYLMIPLAKAMAMKTKKNYVLYVMTIIAGGSIAHSLVPPTPGPLFVAGELSVSLGLMIIGGLIVGLFVSLSGYLYALWINRKWPIAIRETPDISLKELEVLSQKESKDLPPLWLSLLPVVFPLLLISGDTIISTVFKEYSQESASRFGFILYTFFQKTGDPNIALTIAALISIIPLVRQYNIDRKKITIFIQNALSTAGIIVLIISAGGAFGAILQQTGIGSRIQELSTAYHFAVLPMAFLVTALIRVAQGSATVAMITTIGIFAGFAYSGTLSFHPLYLALAVGCGSKPMPWMNDSGFWLICKMSGFTEIETLRNFSVMLTIMGVVGITVIMILAKLFPLV